MADAHGSGPCVGNNMRVQVPSPALKNPTEIPSDFFYFSNHNKNYIEPCFFCLLFSYIKTSALCIYSAIVACCSATKIPILA